MICRSRLQEEQAQIRAVRHQKRILHQEENPCLLYH